MKEFSIKVFQECNIDNIKAENEAEAKAIIQSRIETNKLVFHVTQMNIRNNV